MPDALVDAWLLERFPGKTLEELDLINWPRFMRAMEAQEFGDIEAKKAAMMKGLLKGSAVTRRDLARIKRNDTLYNELQKRLEEEQNG